MLTPQQLYSLRYYEAMRLDPERLIKTRKRQRDYNRKNLIHSDGKFTRAEKRDYPLEGRCELCENNGRKLNYHHWIEENPKVGAWICTHCHIFVHGSESGLTIYDLIDLKHKIESEVYDNLGSSSLLDSR